MSPSDFERYTKMCAYENEAYQNGVSIIAGIDEAGRGPLAGPKGLYIEGLNDSKKVSEKKRDMLFELITEKAVAYGVGIVDHQCIDQINILNATKKAMKNAITALSVVPELLLIDAVVLKDVEISQNSIIKGDALSVSIAAASIIAKVTRDRIMYDYDKIYPQYLFAKHKGYGTSEHIEAIKEHSICEIHRLSFTKKWA